VSAASLPYAVLVLLVELAVGSLAMVTVFDARRQVTSGYVKAGGIVVVPLALLALATYAGLGRVDEVDGYVFDVTWFRPFGVAFGVFAVLAVGHLVASLFERHDVEVRLGAAGSIAGVVSLGMLGAWIAPPAWSLLGVVVSLVAGAAVVGGALMAMTWGHWYLTSGRLPKEPMEQMALVVLVALLVQCALVAAGALAPVRQVPLSEGFGVGLAQNPAFWLRLGVGLAFPLVLTVLAWRAARIRGMMSATGLLYIALGAVLAGEVLGRGLLFTTGAAV
jgi:hypothetical protein